MRLVFGIGLMMLDCAVDPNQKINGGKQELLKALSPHLSAAAQEMSAIDKFSQTYWADALRRLAIRRALWADGASPHATAFPENLRPSLSGFLGNLSSDTEGLFALVEASVRNRVPPEMLRAAISDAGIDLSAQIDFAERLIALSPKRAGIGSEQLSAARARSHGAAIDWSELTLP